MISAIIMWLLIQNGFGQPDGGIELGRFYSRADCMSAASLERLARELPHRFTNDCIPETLR